jgi:hypothetical protein
VQALQQVLASLHVSIVEPMQNKKSESANSDNNNVLHTPTKVNPQDEEKTLVQIYVWKL